MASEKPSLGYWKIRGLAQPIRIMLGYLGVDFNDIMYEQGDDLSREEWLSVKHTLGLDFSNLPYYIDGDIKITQSNAILRYIGRKYGLDGKTEEEKVRVDMMENEIMDFRNGFVRLVYGTKCTNEDKEKYTTNVKPLLELFEKFLGSRTFLAGMEITFPDFHLYELIDQHMLFDPNFMKQFTRLMEYHSNFEADPKVSQFIKSEKFFKGPVNNKSASWK